MAEKDLSTMRQNQAPTEQKKADNFPAMLNAFKQEIAKALPRHLNPDRMARIALTAFRRTPKLAECDPRSVFAAVIQASQLGLEPDTLGRAYLIPYKRECQFVPGWKGLVDLVNRSGEATAWTGAVFKGDEFDFGLGDSPFVSHKPGENFDEADLTHVYAVGRVKGAQWPIVEVWPISKVKKHRDRYNKVGKAHYSFDNFEMYARKVVLLQVLKYMPASPELNTAMSLSMAADQGGQGITIDGALDNDYIAPPPPQDAPQQRAVGGDDGQTQSTPQNQEPPAQSPSPAAAAPETQPADQAAPVQSQAQENNPSGMQFDDALDFIRTSQDREYCRALLDSFGGNEREILREQYEGRFGGLDTDKQGRLVE